MLELGTNVWNVTVVGEFHKVSWKHLISSPVCCVWQAIVVLWSSGFLALHRNCPLFFFCSLQIPNSYLFFFFFKFHILYHGEKVYQITQFPSALFILTLVLPRGRDGLSFIWATSFFSFLWAGCEHGGFKC